MQEDEVRSPDLSDGDIVFDVLFSQRDGLLEDSYYTLLEMKTSVQLNVLVKVAELMQIRDGEIFVEIKSSWAFLKSSWLFAA